MTGIDDDLELTLAVLDGKGLEGVGLAFEMGDPLVDRLLCPYLGWSDDWFTSVEESLRHPVVGVVAVAVADEEHVALVDDAGHKIIGESETFRAPQSGPGEIEGDGGGGGAHDEAVVVEFPDHGASVDGGVFELLDGTEDAAVEKLPDREALRGVHVVEDGVQQVQGQASDGRFG
jgi:hypothetical protein